MLHFFRKKEEPKFLRFDKFWQQKVGFDRIEKRIDYFNQLCIDKCVLHFGCTDWPIFNPKTNLHIKLSQVTKLLHGFDVDLEGIENLKKYVPQEYFLDFNSIGSNKYDVCIVPETIEHVDNVKEFLGNLSKVDAKVFIITAPNAFSKEHMERNFYAENEIIEIVHPDHNCWYSPFTLKNVIEKYSSLKVEKVLLLENDTMVCCQATKAKN